ncbi:MAG: hypothetical protein ACE5FY_07490, partial [Nitrospiria bacterium]
GQKEFSPFDLRKRHDLGLIRLLTFYEYIIFAFFEDFHPHDLTVDFKSLIGLCQTYFEIEQRPEIGRDDG